MTDLALGTEQGATTTTGISSPAHPVLNIEAQFNTASTAIRARAGDQFDPNSGAAIGVDGQSFQGIGVLGAGGFSGVTGEGNFGVMAFGQTAGVHATSEGGEGVHAFGHNAGVVASSDFTGVVATGNNLHGVHGSGPVGIFGKGTVSNGVQGETDSDFASGVYGQNDGLGYGVAGRSDQGVGVLAESAAGVGMKVVGRLQLSRSGVDLVSPGHSSVNVSLDGVAPGRNSIIATLQGAEAGLWVTTVDVQSGSFTIGLNGVAHDEAYVAWFELQFPYAETETVEVPPGSFPPPTEWRPPR